MEAEQHAAEYPTNHRRNQKRNKNMHRNKSKATDSPLKIRPHFLARIRMSAENQLTTRRSSDALVVNLKRTPVPNSTGLEVWNPFAFSWKKGNSWIIPLYWLGHRPFGLHRGPAWTHNAVVRKLLVLPWCEFLYCDKTCTYDNLALGLFVFFFFLI